MKCKYLKRTKYIAYLFLSLNYFAVIETYSQIQSDTTSKWDHMIYLGMPMHKFPEFDKFKVPQFERNASYHSSLPIYLEYNICKNNANFTVCYYYYSWFRIYDDYNFNYTPGTLATRGFGLINLSYIRAIPLVIKEKKVLEFNIGLNLPYRFDGMDDYFLYRISPFEVKTDAIFYRRLGIGINCGLQKQIIKKFKLEVKYNYQYFNEPNHKYPINGLTNYGPNRKMSVIQLGLGYCIEYNNLFGLFKK